MKKLVVVDTETGGLDPATSSILTLGAVLLTLDGKGGSLIGPKFHVMIHEENIVAEPKALAVNGLDLDRIREIGVSPDVATTLFLAWMRDNGLLPKNVTMAGHNAAFDAGFIGRLFTQAKRPNPFSHRRVCTQSIAHFLVLAGIIPDTSTSLDAMTKQFGINIREGGAQGKHDALEDAVATAALLVQLLDKVRATVPSAPPAA